MKKIIICLLLVMFFIAFISACDPNADRMPISYPNTRWVSEYPDMFFEIKSPRANFYTASYAQIIIDGEIIELIVGFRHSQMFVHDIDADLVRDPSIFSGSGRFSPYRVIIRITRNPNGFLDDSIEEIIFYREDIE